MHICIFIQGNTGKDQTVIIHKGRLRDMMPDPSRSQVGKEGAEGGLRSQSKEFPWVPMATISLLAGNITEELCLLMFRVKTWAQKHAPEAERQAGSVGKPPRKRA